MFRASFLQDVKDTGIQSEQTIFPTTQHLTFLVFAAQTLSFAWAARGCSTKYLSRLWLSCAQLSWWNYEASDVARGYDLRPRVTM